MALPVVIPNTFANANASIPLSQLDNNFSTVAVAINGIANGVETLANVNITGGTITNIAFQSSAVGTAYAGISSGGIGTIALLRCSITVTFGNTTTSANLTPTNAAGGTAGSVSGTWRCLGYANSDPKVSPSAKVTAWVRIS
jgi:hypothetical protein